MLAYDIRCAAIDACSTSSASAAGELQLIAAPQLLAQRDEIDGLAAIEQREHGLVGRAMRLGVEVRRAEDLDHAGDGVAAFEKHRAEHRTLGIEVVRRDARGNLEWTHRAAILIVAPRSRQQKTRMSRFC